MKPEKLDESSHKVSLLISEVLWSNVGYLPTNISYDKYASRHLHNTLSSFDILATGHLPTPRFSNILPYPSPSTTLSLHMEVKLEKSDTSPKISVVTSSLFGELFIKTKYRKYNGHWPFANTTSLFYRYIFYRSVRFVGIFASPTRHQKIRFVTSSLFSDFGDQWQIVKLTFLFFFCVADSPMTPNHDAVSDTWGKSKGFTVCNQNIVVEIFVVMTSNFQQNMPTPGIS